MADETNLTKRERQKLRRDQKLAEQRRLAARARRRRLMVLLAAGLVLLGAVGVVIAGQLAERAERAETARQAAQQLEALGCTEAVAQPDLGTGHIGGQELAANPPEAIYPDRPASSGRHIGSVANSGVYDQPVDERFLVHNLEHGYVVVYYDDDLPPAAVEELTSFVSEQLGAFPKLVAAPWQGALPGDANVAFVSWRTRQLCEQFSPEVALTYLNEHHGTASGAPEAAVAPVATEAENPVRPDAEGPFLLPPEAPAPPVAPTAPAPGQPTS
ncbi:MAG TPA: DUF3105 domain-containing protein [Egibacteraceae bacterium]|nr:DUF3105 domain-containing protein [Egibacteraceae bacterium]